jgi:hypothetical protein
MYLFSDGFDAHANLADLLKKWGSASGPVTISAAGGRFGGPCLQIPATGNTYILTKAGLRASAAGAIRIAFSFKCAALPSAIMPLVYFFQPTDVNFTTNFTPNASLMLNTSGQIGFRSFGGGNGAATSGATNICDGNWHWIELTFTPQTTTHAYQIMVDGVSEVSTTITGSTAFNTTDRFALCSTTVAGATIFIDDLIFHDGVAGAITGDINTFPLGDCKIETLRPTGAGSLAQFTPSAGANYTCVDETIPNNDTDYVQSGTTGNKDLYACSDLASIPVSIYGVVANIHVRNADAGAMNVKAAAKSSASNASGLASLLITPGYTTKQGIIPRDPNTSAAWVGAAVNAAEFGFEVA